MFTSLRDDYPGFDQWLEKAAREQRRAWTIEPAGELAGICLWKDDDDEYQLGGKVMKVSTFKVSNQHRGHRYGDLLLKALFQHLSSNSYDRAWLTVFEKHEELVALIEDFGFERLSGRTTELGELVMVKSLLPDENREYGAFEFHQRYGPPALAFSRAPVFVIPIQPQFHRLLFPDYEQQARSSQQPQLPWPQQPFGNALRKAYLSRSGIRDLPSGSTILFYRSADVQGVTSVGVVESTLRSSDPGELAQFANLRTVYSFSQISDLASQEVIAVRFRQDRLLPEAIKLDDLIQAKALAGAPQTITRVTDKEAIEWLRQLIDGSR
jgi:L-amino acid N-acyltransferase YncA